LSRDEEPGGTSNSRLQVLRRDTGEVFDHSLESVRREDGKQPDNGIENMYGRHM
jgi:hypothetical protein